MKKQQTVLMIFALAASVICLLCGLFTAFTAGQNVKNAFGAVWEADASAAGLLADTLLSGRQGNGEEAAKALGLTGRFFDFWAGSAFGGLWLPVLIGLALLPAAAAAFYLRTERRKKNVLEARVESALRGESTFYAEDEEEKLLEKTLNTCAVLRQKADEQAVFQRRQVENAAHELKTPAAGLILTLDLAEESGMTPERMGRMRDCTEQMQRYITELLTLARLRAGRVKLVRKETDLSELLREMAEEVPGAEYEGAEGVIIPGDRERLWEAFRNLAANAVRYSEDGRCLIGLNEEADEVRVRITDRGEGAPQWERYVSGSEDGTSTGLGTAIAAEIIRAHFGTVSAASENGLTAVTAVFPKDKMKKKEPV